MTIINNEAKIKNPIVVKVREQLEHRAMWLALLAREAEKKGVDVSDFGREAIFQCGQLQGKHLSAGKTGYTQLKKALFSKPAQWMFEMRILECTDEKLSIDFHYCPLVKAWQKMGCSDEEIARLCDTAMCGDRGIADCFGGTLELPQVIAKGAPTCQIRFIKKK